MSTISNDDKLFRVLTGGSLDIDKPTINMIPTWESSFILNYKGQQLNVTENTIYFVYEFNQNWFGPYFGISLLFDSNTFKKNKETIQNHESITVTFRDGKTTPFTFTFTRARQSQINSQDVSSSGESLGSMHLHTSIYYPKIIFDLDLSPKASLGQIYSASITTMKELLQESNTVLLTTKNISDVDYKQVSILIKSSTIREALVNIAHQLQYGEQVKSSDSNDGVSDSVKGIVYKLMDQGIYYPFRLSTNNQGTNLLLAFYIDMLDIKYKDTALVSSFTSDTVDYNMLSNPQEYNIVSIMSNKVDYSTGENVNYLKKADKCIINTSFHYHNCIININKPLSEIALLTHFGTFTNSLSKDTADEPEKTIDSTNCDFELRQPHSVAMLKNYLQCSSVIFKPTKGLLPTDFYTNNNGFIIWTITENFLHIASENKISQTPKTEEIPFPSQIVAIKLEGVPVNGNPSIMKLNQTVILTRPMYI